MSLLIFSTITYDLTNNKYFTLDYKDAQNRPLVPLILPFSDRVAVVMGRKEQPKRYQNLLLYRTAEQLT
jgi:hypothetical protein